MQRIPIEPRQNWQRAVEQLGFGFHSTDVPYWDESAHYMFSLAQVDQLERATNTLWDMCLQAVEQVIRHQLWHLFAIPEFMVPHIVQTWEADAPAIYGRFDLWYDGHQPPKLLEFNADTPTSLYEAAIVQWYWLQDFAPAQDQFNSIHEKLVDTWRQLKPYLHPGTLHFACVSDHLEDLTTTEYLRDCAMQAGLDTNFLYINDIGWDSAQKSFVDLANQPMRNIFKLYPYEWMVNETFGQHLVASAAQTNWIEPSWKMILSNKAILPILWKLFPDNEYLLPAFFDRNGMDNFVIKPILAREGANISIIEQGALLESTSGEYGHEGYVFQELRKLPNFQGRRPVIGSWVIGQQAAGIGIREASGLITGNTSRFVPHLIR
jgi:glutathionylspermidine synthase